MQQAPKRTKWLHAPGPPRKQFQTSSGRMSGSHNLAFAPEPFVSVAVGASSGYPTLPGFRHCHVFPRCSRDEQHSSLTETTYRW